MKTLTTVYSSPCVEALENLITSISNTFGYVNKKKYGDNEPTIVSQKKKTLPNIELSDLFYYGVFCKAETYANYTQYVDISSLKVDFPSILTSHCSTADDRLNYVNGLIDKIIKAETVRVEVPTVYDPCTGELISEGEVKFQTTEKPEWMIYVEEDYDRNLCCASPSTFLYLIPKDDKYKDLGEKLIEFLYSPNLTIRNITPKGI